MSDQKGKNIKKAMFYWNTKSGNVNINTKEQEMKLIKLK